MNNNFSGVMQRGLPLQKQHCIYLKYTVGLLVMLLLTANIIAQPNITRVEYYVDNDPGYGNGKAVKITPATDIQDLQLAYNFSALTSGVHIIGIRSQDENGAWSLDNKWLFLKPYALKKVADIPPITRLEYYIDNDPGKGNGTPIAIVPAPNLPNIPLTLDLTPLAEGVHVVGIRSQDSTGAWGLDNKWLFVKSYTNAAAASAPKLQRLEYYFDTDPGYGNGTALNIPSSADIIDFSLKVDLTPLYEGVHIVGIRSQDVNGRWSLDNKWLFVKPYSQAKSPGAPALSKIEYYIDTDPGKGNGISIPFGQAANVPNLPFTVNLAPLAEGVHIVGIRSMDTLGQWSLDNKWLFLKKYTASPFADTASITDVEYYIDFDPGYGHATAVSIVPGNDLSNLSFPVNISSLSIAQHFIGIRSKNANGAWSLDNKYAFTKTQPLGLMGAVNKMAAEAFVNSLRLQFNPVHNQATLLYTATKNDRISIQVVDNAGRVVAAKQVNVFMGVNPITLETATLAQGVYIVQATGEKNNLSVKMLKQ